MMRDRDIFGEIEVQELPPVSSEDEIKEFAHKMELDGHTALHCEAGNLPKKNAEFLRHFTFLEDLRVIEQVKNVEAIGDLKRIERLFFSSVSFNSADFLAQINP